MSKIGWLSLKISVVLLLMAGAFAVGQVWSKIEDLFYHETVISTTEAREKLNGLGLELPENIRDINLYLQESRDCNLYVSCRATPAEKKQILDNLKRIDHQEKQKSITKFDMPIPLRRKGKSLSWWYQPGPNFEYVHGSNTYAAYDRQQEILYLCYFTM